MVSAVSVYDPEKKGFIVTFTIDEGARYRFGKVDIQSNVPMVDPKSLYSRLRAGAGDVYNAEAVEKSVENLSIEVARRGYPFAVVRPRGDRDQATHHHQRRLHGRRRPARLHRADQHPRQHPHPRLCDPARIRCRRRRRIQPRADRSRRTAPEEPQLFQDASRSPTSRARRPTASCSTSMSRKSRPASSRSRAATRPPAAGWPNSASPNAICSARASMARVVGAVRPIRPRLRAVVRRAVFPGQSPWRRHRSLRQANAGDELHFVRQPNRRHRNAGRICAERRTVVPGSLQHLLAENHAAVSIQQLSVLAERASQRRSRREPATECGSSGASSPADGGCYADGESSLAVRKELAAGAVLVSMLGYTRRLQHPRQQQEPDRRPLRRVQAGLRRRRRRRQFHPLDRRCAQLLRNVLRRRRRAASARRSYRRLGRQRPAHAGSFPDGTEPGPRLCAVRASVRAT